MSLVQFPLEPPFLVYTWHALVAQLDRVFGYEPKGQGFESLRAHHYREMAQLGRALGLGPRGCRFKSCLPDHEELNVDLSTFFYIRKLTDHLGIQFSFSAES